MLVVVLLEQFVVRLYGGVFASCVFMLTSELVPVFPAPSVIVTRIL